LSKWQFCGAKRKLITNLINDEYESKIVSINSLNVLIYILIGCRILGWDLAFTGFKCKIETLGAMLKDLVNYTCDT